MIDSHRTFTLDKAFLFNKAPLSITHLALEIIIEELSHVRRGALRRKEIRGAFTIDEEDFAKVDGRVPTDIIAPQEDGAEIIIYNMQIENWCATDGFVSCSFYAESVNFNGLPSGRIKSKAISNNRQAAAFLKQIVS